jgi:hypothetical protein
VLSTAIIGYEYNVGAVGYYSDGRYDVAVMLSNYQDHQYTMATTEAGLLPLYSHWKAVDTWGLNDQWIAHQKGLTEAYLSSHNPEMIIFHEYFSPLAPPNNRSGEWFDMVMTLKRYAETHGYVLAASYGDSPYDTHYYYVRPDFEHSSEIITAIQTINYTWWGTGNQAINYAAVSARAIK